jgi:hypothetical protein
VTAKERSALLIWSISGVIAITYLLTEFDVCSAGGGFCDVIFLLALPGMLLSALVSNIHDPNPWLVVLFNWISYFFVLMGLNKLVRNFRGN